MQWPYRLRSTRAMTNPSSFLEASEALAANCKFTSDLKPATLITLVSMCILPQTAVFKAMEASKQPRRSLPASDLNSVTSNTYVPMPLWPLNVTVNQILPEGQISSIDFVSSTEVKTSQTISQLITHLYSTNKGKHPNLG